ncbi:DUF5054 domain-containing protein [Vagococcus fluvialis]|uniref:DUF5054 domain-containing protein n=1 Tax=Vagococcus fluvialis TaxID=2738 RepID=UPI003B59D571
MKKKLHVIYKTHLDIGFTDLAENVTHTYLYDFIPKAIELGNKIPEKFTWTTGSWLIDFYLKHPDISDSNKDDMRKAIKEGTIRWHGLPFTTHTELLDDDLMEYALSISKELDTEFNKTTIASKLTDIPGHTISMVPYLEKAGIKYLHIGVNASSAIPKIPKIFIWKAFDGSELIVHYASDYGEVFEKEEWNDALYFAHSHDNAGPPQTVEEIEELFKDLEQKYPDYDIIPSTLDAFAEAILPYQKELPIIEEEIADTWIHGLTSDPKKTATYRALLRLRKEWIKDGKITKDSLLYKEFSAQLLMVAEHTWGVNGNVYLPDYSHFLLNEFEEARKKDLITFQHDRKYMDYGDLMSYISTDIELEEMSDRRRYSIYEASWLEQRNYLEKAINLLPVDLQKEAYQVLKETTNNIVDINQNIDIIPGVPYTFDNVTLSFSTTGGLNQLIIDGYHLIEDGKEFGGLSYERFDFSDYMSYYKNYCRLTNWTSSWALGDHGRRGIAAYQEIRHEIIKPFITNSSMTVSDKNIKIVLNVTYKDTEISNWGLPKTNQLIYMINLETKQIDLAYSWKEKKANPMPESYWLETSISVANPTRWVMEKISHPVSPQNVVANGNRNLHCLSDEGLTYTGYEGEFNITSHDSPIFSLGRRGLLKFDNQIPDLNDGIFVNLFNNVWGTNFTAWFEEDMTYQTSFKWHTNEPY